MNATILLRVLLLTYPAAHISMQSDPISGEVRTWEWSHPDGIAAPTDAELDALYTAGVLQLAQSDALATIDAEAERRRGMLLTPGSGQMATYQAKEVQARDLLADAAPTEANYPDIYNEVGITSDTVQGVATAVLAAAEAWRGYGRAIEKVRLSGKKAVSGATDPAGVAALIAAIVWPEVPTA